MNTCVYKPFPNFNAYFQWHISATWSSEQTVSIIKLAVVLFLEWVTVVDYVNFIYIRKAYNCQYFFTRSTHIFLKCRICMHGT